MGKQGLYGTNADMTPALGLSWANLVTTRLMLTRTDSYIKGHQVMPSQPHLYADPEQNTSKDVTKRAVEYNIRTLEVIFCPWLGRKSCSFVVTERGIEDVTVSDSSL